MSFSMPRNITKVKAPPMAKGTDSSTAQGSIQRS